MWNVRRAFETLHALHVLEVKWTLFRFFPCASGEQGADGRRALESLHEGDYVGTTQHFRISKEHVSAERHAKAVYRNITERNPSHANPIKKQSGHWR